MMRHLIQSGKQITLGCLLCACVFVFSACGNAGVPLKEEANVIFPSVKVPYAAPIGDAALEYSRDYTLYLPRYDGAHLLAMSATVPCSAARLDEESVIRALLANEGNGVASAIGGGVELSLYGANPVEVSGDVATVNLAASALQLDRKTLYLCSQAIANTLTELNGIRYVNVLVMDKQIGLDLGSTLPMGTLTRSVATDVGAVYEQLLSQRVNTDEKPKERRLSTTVTLYFPLTATDGIMAEARNVSFTSQDPSDMVARILEELSDGPEAVTGSPTLPLLAGLLSQPPKVTEPTDGSGKLISLYFDSSMDDQLKNNNVSRASCLGAISYSLCTFLPNVAGITVYIGGELVEHVMLGAASGILFTDGVEHRTDYASLLMADGTLFFPEAQGKGLVKVSRPMPCYLRTNPRSLLLELFRGPVATDSRKDTKPVLSPGTLTDADILGLSLNDRTLAVNFSPAFARAGETVTSGQDRLLAYALTNTLLYSGQASRICFFVGGNEPAGFSGEIDWTGYFYQNNGMVEK